MEGYWSIVMVLYYMSKVCKDSGRHCNVFGRNKYVY
jgi:hypothetical protein